MLLGVKGALGILLHLWKNEAPTRRIGISPYVVIRGDATSPFSALPAQRIWPANEIWTLALTPWSTWTATWRRKGLSPAGGPLPVSRIARFSLLQIDVEVEEPETSENPTQSFVIHNFFWRRTQLLALIICITWRRKGLLSANVSRLSPASRCPAAEGPPPWPFPLQEAVVPRQRGSDGRQPRSTIPFSSMSWFSLLQIDMDVEEPELSENPTQSFEIHNIVWRRTQLLALIIYIIWYRYLCMIWNESLAQVKEFKYLGVMFASEGTMEREIGRRIGATSSNIVFCFVITKKTMLPNASLLWTGLLPAQITGMTPCAKLK